MYSAHHSSFYMCVFMELLFIAPWFVLYYVKTSNAFTAYSIDNYDMKSPCT